MSFPRDKSSVLELHVDTCVMLNVSRVKAVVAQAHFRDDEATQVSQI